ncbi:MAG: hypothetical protein JO115_21555 [Pseudonocardiales bacterium]|nr:hypothetical protein [Pseudonocardiales bacterium]
MLTGDERSGRVVTLCGVQGCCPTVEFSGLGIVLRDDFGGRVQLTEDQWADLLHKVWRGELA